MESSSQQRQHRKPRGDFFIPPLPQSNLRVDKENQGRSASSNVAGAGAGAGCGCGGQQTSSKDSHIPMDRQIHSLNESSIDKENAFPIAQRGVLAPVHFSDNISLSANNSSSLRGLKSGRPEKDAGVPPFLNSYRKTSSSTLSTRRVLRYRETMESLFCLTSKCSSEHWQLCRDIVEGEMADDAFTWLRVLQLAKEQDERNRGSSASSTTQGKEKAKSATFIVAYSWKLQRRIIFK